MDKINIELHNDLDLSKYIIIPIGINCTTGLFLRNCGIKCYTYPYDWANNTNVDEILNVLNDTNFNVNNWFRLSNLPYYLPHDKLNDTHGEDENAFLNTDLVTKYKRRFERLFLDIKKPNIILCRYYTHNNDKLTIIQKEKFRSINNTLSFIELNNFSQTEIEGESVYKNYMLTLFKPNISTLIIKDVIDYLGKNIKIYPINYSDFYEWIIHIINNYNIDKNIFPDKSNILFNNRKELLHFLGNCLMRKFTNIELFG